MPFGFDMSQVFAMLMQKTMWDCKFGNMNSFGGGGFMNSCWGGGFPMMGMGDCYNFNNTFPPAASNNKKTAEERAEDTIIKQKHETLYATLEEYVNTLDKSKTETQVLIEKLKDLKTANKDNYEGLQRLYKENKAAIDKHVDKDGKITVAQTSKNAASIMNKNKNRTTPIKYDSWIEDNNLKPEYKSLEILEELMGYKDFYDTSMKNQWKKEKPEVAGYLSKLTIALFTDLKNEANKIKDNTSIKEDAQKTIKTYLEKDTASAADIDKFFNAIKEAKKQIAEARKESLKEAAQSS